MKLSGTTNKSTDHEPNTQFMNAVHGSMRRREALRNQLQGLKPTWSVTITIRVLGSLGRLLDERLDV